MSEEVRLIADKEVQWYRVLKTFISTPCGYETTCYLLEGYSSPVMQAQIIEKRIMNKYPVICAITCTKGRHTHLERCVGLFLSQDYPGKVYQLIYNNSKTEQALAPGTPDNVILVNRSWNEKGEPYSHLGEIFQDALAHVPLDAELITFFDDDDIFLPNHLSEGAKGYEKAKALGKKGYKPWFSWLQTGAGIEKTHNLCEPSFFVEKEHLLEHGFSDHSAAYHHQWINPLLKNGLLHEPLEGMPTFLYQWVGGVFHLSGDGENPENFLNHAKNSQDEGDFVITPDFSTKINLNGK